MPINIRREPNSECSFFCSLDSLITFKKLVRFPLKLIPNGHNGNSSEREELITFLIGPFVLCSSSRTSINLEIKSTNPFFFFVYF